MPIMCDAGYGRMVMTSSIAGLYSQKNLAAYAVSKAGLIGLSHTIAHEGAPYGVTCNAIIPSAMTRLSEGRDTSSFPDTMTPETVAPAIAWLVHENCKATGEIYVMLAGRVAKAFVTETVGVFREHWTIEQVARAFRRDREHEESPGFPTVSERLHGPSGIQLQDEPA